MVGLAAGFGLGVALLPHAGHPRAAALILTALLLLVQLFKRPALPTSLALAVAAGAMAGWVSSARTSMDCRWSVPDGFEGVVTGRFAARPGDGAAPFQVVDGLPGGCRSTVAALLGKASSVPAVGQDVRARARWRASRRPRKGRPDLAGTLVLDSLRVIQRAERGPRGGHRVERLRARLVRARGALQATLHELLPGTASLADALILARKEGLTPERRERFARSGTAHLLAISGFHVGVLAGLMLSLARIVGAGPRGATLAAALGAWVYVAFIGAPDAASRAALILSLFAAARLLGRPVVPVGALSTAFLMLVLLDPAALGRPGLQLSFAGAAGLVYGMKPLSALLAGRWTGWLPAGVRSGIAAGVSATLATLPLVAWHFDRVSLVGIPATLTAAPLVALAIPGLLAVLLSAPLSPGLASFLAGGVDLVLRALEWVVSSWASFPHASAWVPRVWVVGGALGALAGLWYARSSAGVGRRVRLALILVGLTCGWLASPMVGAWASADTVELTFLDVGQGDAIAIRSPRGRWILVDAGPRGQAFDAGRRVVVPFLRRRGVDRLAAMVLTHPDMDHIGGAVAVLEDMRVDAVLDPAVAVGKAAYLSLLEVASERGVTWLGAREGGGFVLDGLEIAVLAPRPPRRSGGVPGVTSGADVESNDQSVVLELRFGAFRALLTGDAPASVERRVVMERAPAAVQVLKVGHHGSATSTPWEARVALRPEVAVISVGARNRYGHPAPEVTERLERAGAWILRTDRVGAVTVRARSDGSYQVTMERGPERR